MSLFFYFLSTKSIFLVIIYAIDEICDKDGGMEESKAGRGSRRDTSSAPCMFYIYLFFYMFFLLNDLYRHYICYNGYGWAIANEG